MKKKNALKTFILTLGLTFFASTCNALSGTVNSSDGVNFRSEPDADKNNIIAALKYNTKVTLESLEKHDGPGCDSGWYKVIYSSKTGYICSMYVTANNVTTEKSNYYTTSGYEARVSDDIVSIRKSASADSTLVTKVMFGESLKILKTSPKGNGCDDPWYKVSFRDNKTGYICSTYVKKYTEVAVTSLTDADNEYCNSLVEAGFPKSYCPYLIKMHKDHPTWDFKPVKTNLKWSSVINGESGKNYVTKTITEKSYRVSDKLLDGGACYGLKDSVNAFYLDPRNYLNERNIFVFQTLTFDENISTFDNIKKIVSGTDLDKENIINAFINAGRTNNVSPVHTASRVIQEGVSSDKHSGLSGNSSLKYRKLSLKGYYNLFNIGAWEDDYTTNPVARGLAFACGALGKSFKTCGTYTSYGRPWNSIEKAINGGTLFLGEDYISVGQYTLYFQKFNTSNVGKPYTNQYMTNIHAPISEGIQIYDLYKKINVLNNVNMTFSIPVYTNMPEEITTLPPVGDSTNTLSSLKINDVLVNGFDSDVITYTKYVPYDTESVNITATPTSSLSTVEGTGKIELQELSTEVKIVVTSETLEDKIYKVTIIRTEESSMTIDDLINRLDVKINENYIYITKPGTSANTLLNNISKQSATASLNLVDSNDIYKSTGVLVTNDKLTIKMLNGEERTFNIIILGDTNGDGKTDIVDLLRIQKHILKNKKLSGNALEAADTDLNGKADIKDLLRVQKYILKSIKEFK